MTKRAALASSRLLSSGGSKGCRLPTFSLSVRASGAVCPLDFADALRVPAPPGGWLLSPPELSRPRVRLVCGGREGGAGRQLGAPWPHGPTWAGRGTPPAARGQREGRPCAGPLRARGARGCARVRSCALAAAAAPLSQQTPPTASPPAGPYREEPSEFVSVWVRDPRIQKEDFWHSYIDYEICIHTNSICFTMKTSCVRRRYREFVWLRQRLQSNALLVQLPELPSKNLFFNMNNRQHVDQRRQGLEDFLRKVLQNALLLSDSSLHLFLQSHLNSDDMEACVSGQTKYSVEEAIHKFALMNRRFPEEDEEGKKEKDIDYDSESSSSGFGHSSDDSSSHGCKMSTAPQES
nr:sorting nexin-10 isoform X1 [Manis javanica]